MYIFRKLIYTLVVKMMNSLQIFFKIKVLIFYFTLCMTF